ncbi:MAG: ribulose-phosphate 3-epimerase, partial [Candidatus Nitrosocosmicus sp.]
FVPNTTFFDDTIRNLRGITNMPFDTHLMIDNPYDVLDSYIDAGCDVITVHAEVCKDEKEFEKINDKLVSSGVSPGLAINPDTQLPRWIYNYLDCLDVMIIMSVNPGFAGQKFIPSVLSKMKTLIPDLRNNGYKGYFEADGGVDLATISSCYEAGCRIFVMGNAIFGSGDIIESIKNTKFLLNTILEKELLIESESLGIREDWIKNRKDILKRFNLIEEICK